MVIIVNSLYKKNKKKCHRINCLLSDYGLLPHYTGLFLCIKLYTLCFLYVLLEILTSNDKIIVYLVKLLVEL